MELSVESKGSTSKLHGLPTTHGFPLESAANDVDCTKVDDCLLRPPARLVVVVLVVLRVGLLVVMLVVLLVVPVRDVLLVDVGNVAVEDRLVSRGGAVTAGRPVLLAKLAATTDGSCGR